MPLLQAKFGDGSMGEQGMDAPGAVDHLGDIEINNHAGQTQGVVPGEPKFITKQFDHGRQCAQSRLL